MDLPIPCIVQCVGVDGRLNADDGFCTLKQLSSSTVTLMGYPAAVMNATKRYLLIFPCCLGGNLCFIGKNFAERPGCLSTMLV